MRESIKVFKENPDYYFFTLLVFSLPFYKRVTASLFLIWFISWLLGKIFIRKEKKWFDFNNQNQKIIFAILVIYFIFLTTSLLWSSNINGGLHKLETKLSLILAPIVLLNSNNYFKNRHTTFLKAFVFGLIMASVITILLAIFRSFCIEYPAFYFSVYCPFNFQGVSFHPGNNFYYKYFSEFMHPTYFSMMIAMGAILVQTGFVQFNYRGRNLSVIVLLLFLLILFFLSSKAGIILTYLLLIIDVIYKFFTNKKTIKLLKEIFIYTGLFLLTLNYNPRIPSDVLAESTNFSVDASNIKHYNSFNERIIIWKSSIKVFQMNPLIGVGIGDLKEELLKEYNSRGFESGIKRKLNAHNQFIESAINIGLWGPAFLFILLFLPFVFHAKKRNLLALYFIILVGGNFLFESILEKQTGVIFFAVFYTLFVLDTIQIKR